MELRIADLAMMLFMGDLLAHHDLRTAGAEVSRITSRR
jgi:hypothetical protein